MRLTTRTSLAMRVMMYCAVNDGVTVRQQDIAAACNASGNHLAQVVHLLAQRGFIQTIRGRKGGLRLARPPHDVSAGDLFRSFEAPLPFAECFPGGQNQCPLSDACRLNCALSEALAAFCAVLDRTTLRDLTRDNTTLTDLLKIA